MRKLWIIYILVILVLFGCTAYDVRDTSSSEAMIASEGVNTSTIIDTNSDATENSEDWMLRDQITYGFVKDDDSVGIMSVFEYNGETLSIPFMFETLTATGHDAGLLVFIGGVPQSYSIEYADGTISEKNVMQKIPLTEEGKMEFNLLIDPNIGKKGDKLGIYVCNIIYPSFQPDQVEEPSYQYYGSLAQLVPQQIKFEVDAQTKNASMIYAKNGMELSEDITNAILAFSNSIEENLDENYYVELYQNTRDELVMTSENGKIKLHLIWYGGVEGIYNTIIFINNEPVSIEGMNSIQVEAKRNKMSLCDITLDISDYDYLNTIYAIAVPSDDSYLEYSRIAKTNSKLLANDLKKGSDEESLADQAETKELVDESTRVAQNIETNIEYVDMIDLDETFEAVLRYFVDENEQEQLLYQNDKGELVLYNCTLGQVSFRYQLLPKDFESDMVESKLMAYTEEEFVLHTYTAEAEETKDLGNGVVSGKGIENSKTRIYRFDYQLNLIESYDLDKIWQNFIESYNLEIIFPEYQGCVSMSQDGKKLVLYGDGRLIFYDLESEEQRQVDEAIMEKLKDINILEMALSWDEKKIGFLGTELDSDIHDVCGVIDLDLKKITVNQMETSYGNKLYQVGDIAYITDGQVPQKYIASGKIICMDLTLGEISNFMVDNLESTTACLSQNQSRLVAMSSILSKEKKSVGWAICVYDFESGEVIWKGEIESGGGLVKLVASKEKMLVILALGSEGSRIIRIQL